MSVFEAVRVLQPVGAEAGGNRNLTRIAADLLAMRANLRPALP